MAVTSGWYGEALKGQWSATAGRRQDWVTGDPPKCALTTSGYTINAAGGGHDFFNDVTNEVAGTGYSAGGVTLSSRTLAIVSSTLQFDAADPSWTTATFTARRAVVWFDTAGASSADPLFGWLDFGVDASVSAGTFTISWDPAGVANIAYT